MENGYVIYVGNEETGQAFFGPYSSYDQAIEAGVRAQKAGRLDGDWTVTVLQKLPE